ncbi:MAG: DUF4190 domain-containing protein [Propionibacteriaceae bacterium]
MSNPYEQNPNPERQPGDQGQPPSDQSAQPWGSAEPAGPSYGSSAASASEPYGSQPGYGTPNPYGAGPDPYAAQSGYGMPIPYGGGYGYNAPMPHPQGTAVLVLGIVGLVVCFPAGIVAIVMGNRALKEVDANPSAYTNRQSIVAGRILGIIGTALWALIIVFYVIIVVVAAGTLAGN